MQSAKEFHPLVFHGWIGAFLIQLILVDHSVSDRFLRHSDRINHDSAKAITQDHQIFFDGCNALPVAKHRTRVGLNNPDRYAVGVAQTHEVAEHAISFRRKAEYVRDESSSLGAPVENLSRGGGQHPAFLSFVSSIVLG